MKVQVTAGGVLAVAVVAVLGTGAVIGYGRLKGLSVGRVIWNTSPLGIAWRIHSATFQALSDGEYSDIVEWARQQRIDRATAPHEFDWRYSQR